jgi:hypothetical protein
MEAVIILHHGNMKFYAMTTHDVSMKLVSLEITPAEVEKHQTNLEKN